MAIYPINSTPTVSIIIPARNEELHISRCLESLLSQDYPNVIEILVFDGSSEDGTRDIVEDMQRRHPIIRLIDNPSRVQTVAFNKGLKVAHGEIIVRADAHGTYDERYVTEIVRVLVDVEKAGAAVGPMYVDVEGPKTLRAKAIGIAHYSKFGIGAGKLHDIEAEGWADAGCLGGYWKSLLLQAGGFRTELLRTEDIDLYSRLRSLGYGLYLSPKIRAHYTPRNTLRSLWRQNFSNGMGVLQSLFTNRKALSFRHLVPFGFVLSLAAGLFLASLSGLGMAWPGLVAIPYIIGVAFFSLYDGFRYSPSCIPVMPIVFATIHLSYGGGSIYGLIKSLYRKARFGDINIFGVEA